MNPINGILALVVAFIVAGFGIRLCQDAIFQNGNYLLLLIIAIAAAIAGKVVHLIFRA